MLSKRRWFPVIVKHDFIVLRHLYEARFITVDPKPVCTCPSWPFLVNWEVYLLLQMVCGRNKESREARAQKEWESRVMCSHVSRETHSDAGFLAPACTFQICFSLSAECCTDLSFRIILLSQPRCLGMRAEQIRIAFWVVKQQNFLEGYRRFGRTFCFRLQISRYWIRTNLSLHTATPSGQKLGRCLRGYTAWHTRRWQWQWHSCL